MLSVALGLIKFVPDLIGMFDKKKGKQAQDIAATVTNVAETITGKKGEDAVTAINADPALAYKFQIAVMADSHVQEQMELDNTNAARDMYKVNPEQASKVANNIMKYNLVIVFLLVVINVFAVMYLKDDAAVLAIVSNFIGIVMMALLQERQAVVNFFFGSSMGSKNKVK
tara:strand:+ start:1192 stop:1701 length:510 start_codon:yes stop_codon:yes gene_type:complete